MKLIPTLEPALGWSGLAATLLLAASALPAQAASFRCSASVGVNTGHGENNQSTDFSSPTPCQARFGDPATSQSSASAVAGNGILRGGSAVTGYVEARDGLVLGARSLTGINDTAVVGGLGADGALLSFSVLVNGNLFAFTNDFASPNNPAVGASFAFTASLGGSGVGGGGSTAVLDGCVKNSNSSISFCGGEVVPNQRSFNQIVPLSVFAHNGDTLSLGLILQTSATAFIVGNFAQAGANFGHTVNWLGLNADAGSRGLILTSASGYDYTQSSLAAVPEPATWALMIAGFGFAGSALRRGRQAARYQSTPEASRSRTA